MSVYITNNLDPNNVGTPSIGNLVLFSGLDNKFYYKRPDGNYFPLENGGYNSNISLNPLTYDLTITDSNGTLTASLLPLASGYFNTGMSFNTASNVLSITDGFGSVTTSLSYYERGFNQNLSYNTASNVLSLTDGNSTLTASLTTGGANNAMTFNPFTNILEVTDGFGSVTASLALLASTVSGSSTGLLDISYSQFLNGLTQSNLTPSFYRINDFQTKGWILGATDSASYSGILEPLIVYAASGSCFPEAKSEVYPEDEILYDPYPTNWLTDKSFSKDSINIIPDFKGVIYNRKDTIRNIECSFDWRNSVIRRWKLDTSSMGLTSWGAGTWSRNDIVEDLNGVVYYCLEDHNTDGLSATVSFNPNQYYATSSTTNFEVLRNNVRYHWFRLFEKDLYLLPAWQLGTISNTYSLYVGPNSDSPPWGTASTVKTLDLIIDLSSYQDFNLFGIHGTTSIKTDVFGIKMIQSKEESITTSGSIVLTNRIESNKKVLNLEASGSNLTIFDNVPVQPNLVFSTIILEFSNNKFSQFQRLLLYGDEWVTSDNPSVTTDWYNNILYGNIDVFGFSNGNKINSLLFSTIEDSFLLNINSLLVSSIRSSSRIVSDITLRSAFLSVSACDVVSNGDYFIGFNSVDISESNGNRFQLNVNNQNNTINSEFGPQFENNLIGPNGISETVISSKFEDNYFYGIIDSEIGSNINGLTGSTSSTMENVIIESDSISNIDLSSATHIYADYGTTIYKRPDGQIRLRYWDNADTIQIVSATA